MFNKLVSRRYGVLITMLIVLITVFSCERNSDTSGSEKLYVVCTTGMVEDLVSRIGGNHVHVEALMGPGVDPHLFKASQGAIRKLSSADIIFYNGLHLEGKMTEIFEKMSRLKQVVPVTRDIDRARLIRPEEYEGAYDPHVWFDVSLWKKTIPVVAAQLIKSDSLNRLAYEQNAHQFSMQLDTLHTWVAQQITSIPPQQRVLITAHDAFTYFGEAYNIEVMGLQGISTIAEYGINDVNRLVNSIVDRKIKAIFVESSVPQRSINAVKEGCAAKGFNVKIGGTLYSDALGGPGSGAENYMDMVRTNVNTIVEALR